MANKLKASKGKGSRAPRANSSRTIRHQHELQVLRSFRIIFGSVRQHFRDIEKKCGISGSQVWILKEIDRGEGIGVSELAELLAIHQSTCSQLVEKLVRSGQIVKKRSAEDQRRVGLQLTARGRKTLSSAPGPTEGVLPEALSELSDKGLTNLQRCLGSVISKMDVEMPGAGGRPLAEL